MTLRPREHPEAHQELLAAAQWYDDQRLGLGHGLLEAVDTALGNILKWPLAAAPLSRPHRDPIVRSASVPDFPYRIIYFVTRDELVLIAYAHERRKPGYWKRRL